MAFAKAQAARACKPIFASWKPSISQSIGPPYTGSVRHPGLRLKRRTSAGAPVPACALRPDARARRDTTEVKYADLRTCVNGLPRSLRRRGPLARSRRLDREVAGVTIQ